MDNFIVRIYRRCVNDPQVISGVIEIVGSNETRAFKHIEDICEILISGGKKTDRKSRKSGGAKTESRDVE